MVKPPIEELVAARLQGRVLGTYRSEWLQEDLVVEVLDWSEGHNPPHVKVCVQHTRWRGEHWVPANRVTIW